MNHEERAAENSEQPVTDERTVELLNEYGAAKFGDEWWPGNAGEWIGREKGLELAVLLDPGAAAEYLAPEQDAEPVVTVEGRTYYTVPSTGEAICPECGRTRSTERIGDHMASEHDDDCDGDWQREQDQVTEEYDDGNTLTAGVLYGPDGYEAEPAGDFPAQGGVMKLTPREVTQLEAALEDMRRVQRNLDEDRVNHDTVQEQTGEGA